MLAGRKKKGAFYRWFWERPLFRGLRQRLMTMVLALVLPVSLISMALSVVSIHRSVEVNRTTNQNSFSFYLSEVVLRLRAEGQSPLENFPEKLASALTLLYWNTGAQTPAQYNGGSVYVSRDREEAFLILQDGTWTEADAPFAELKQAKFQFLWEKEDQPFQVLVTFPYDFSLRNVPIWYWMALVISALTLISCPLLYFRLKSDILSPMETLRSAQTALSADRNYRIPPQPESVSDDYRRLFDGFNDMAEVAETAHEKELRLLETEMDNLRLQVNPHMLLNSYNMIYALAQSKNYATIQDYTLCLTDYFRYVLRRGQQQVTVRQELDFVENFIHIQKIRFPGRFNYIYQAEEDCLDALIPPLLIENFVENAIKYALKPDEPIEIVVSLHIETDESGEKTLHISVMDTGSGIQPEVLESLKAHEPYIDKAGHKHIGIWNCFRRIELFYGEKGDVRFSSAEGAGTQAYMVIPCVYERKEGQT